MIDISHKFNTLRYARVEGSLKASPEIITMVRDGKVPKGDVMEVARAAGIAAGKATSERIVFCHPMPLDWVEIHFEILENRILVYGEVKAVWKTGVEMEALSAVSGALLNMYDMLKPLSDDIVIGEMRLVEKRGGKSDFSQLFDPPLRAAVLVISDSTFAGKRDDTSGKAVREYLEKQGLVVPVFEVLPDQEDRIADTLASLAGNGSADLIVTTGGTGLGPKDVTPEATRRVIEREVPGICEAIRRHGKERTPFAMLSREAAGIAGQALIINLPGSRKGCVESLQALFPGLPHIFSMLRGEGHNH